MLDKCIHYFKLRPIMVVCSDSWSVVLWAALCGDNLTPFPHIPMGKSKNDQSLYMYRFCTEAQWKLKL